MIGFHLYCSKLIVTLIYHAYVKRSKVTMYMMYYCCFFSEGDNVEVDESLFQDMDDLDIGEEDIDIED